MKLLQWNIWTQEKIENIAKVIKDLDPDFVCLQEITADSDANKGVHTAEYLRDLLGFHMFYKAAQTWKPLTDIKSEQGNCILSKFPIAGVSFSMIQPLSEDPFDASHEGRIYLEAELKLKDKYLTVGTTHLSYTKAFADLPLKAQEAEILAKELRKNSSNYIFSGDLNALPDSSTIKAVSAILKNASPDFQKPSWTTKPFQDGDFQADELKYRLDYVFTTPDIIVTDTQFIKSEYSDHLPILTTFDLA